MLLRSSRRSLMQLPAPVDGYIPCRGGLDLETPRWEVPPGRLRDAINYEIVPEGGYRRIDGYERFDGRTRPSEAGWKRLPVTISGSVSVNDVVTGATSGATGTVAYVDTSGATTYLVVTKDTGTFNASEDLEVSAVVEATTIGSPGTNFSDSAAIYATYKNAVADVYRADITQLPNGSVRVSGVFTLGSTLYAFQSKGASDGLYKATITGWVEVDLGYTLTFTSGSEEPAEGATLVDSSTAATGVVGRVIVTSGDWGTGDAAGRIILTSKTGTFGANTINISGGSTNVLTSSGTAPAQTIDANGGTYRFDKSNFADPDNDKRVYGANGGDVGFEFDGTVFVRIITGRTVDTPTHVKVLGGHVFWAFGSELQISGYLDPYSYTLLTGGDQLLVDDEITDLLVLQGNADDRALAVFQRNVIHILYGTTGAWSLVRYREEIGAYTATAQMLGRPIYLHERGLSDLYATEAWGNFKDATLSGIIQRAIIGMRNDFVASCISRDKNQYRIYTGTGTGFHVSFERGKVVGFMPIDLNFNLSVVWSEEVDSGEQIYAGSTNGWVYQLDKGTSFDGAAINAYAYFHYTNDGIRQLKRFTHHVYANCEVLGWGQLTLDYLLSDGDSTDYAQPGNGTTQDVESSSSTDNVWTVDDPDDRAFVQVYAAVEGIAENIGFRLGSSVTDKAKPVRVTGLHYRYVPLRPIR